MYTKLPLYKEPLRVLLNGGNFGGKNPTKFVGTHKNHGCGCLYPYTTDSNGCRDESRDKSCRHIVSRLVFWMVVKANWELEDVLEAASDYDHKGMAWARSEGCREGDLETLFTLHEEDRSERRKADEGTGTPKDAVRSPGGAPRKRKRAKKHCEPRTFGLTRAGWPYMFHRSRFLALLTYLDEHPAAGRNDVVLGMRSLGFSDGDTKDFLKEAGEDGRGYITQRVGGPGTNRKNSYAVVAWPLPGASAHSVILKNSLDADHALAAVSGVDYDSILASVCSDSSSLSTTPRKTTAPPEMATTAPPVDEGLPQSQHPVLQHPEEAPHEGLPQSVATTAPVTQKKRRSSTKKIYVYDPTPEAQALLRLDAHYEGAEAYAVRDRVWEYAENLGKTSYMAILKACQESSS